MSYLVFVDTNIFLDFYRLRGREKNLSILDHVGEHQEHFIITSQVEMEFKKNRQRVILDSYERIRPPTFEDLSQLPAFLSDSKQSKAVETHSKKVKGLTKKLRARTERVLKKPTLYDPVYKAAQRLFIFSSPYNLDRNKKIRFKVRNLARKRFMLGYPPRKANDTSMGDAVNWEWIIHCATESGKNIVIVSRDSDFGVTFGGEPVLNDWLAQEFHKRVSKKRKIVLTNRLSAGLKAAEIGVTKTEIDVEEEFLGEQDNYLSAEHRLQDANVSLRDVLHDVSINEVALRVFRDIQARALLPKTLSEEWQKVQEQFREPAERLRQLQEKMVEPAEELRRQLQKYQKIYGSVPKKPDKDD